MTKWLTAPLGDVIELAYGKSLPKGIRAVGGKIPVYGSNGITGWHDQPLVNGSTIIVGRKGSAGAIQLVQEPCYPIDTTYFVRIRQGFEVETKFLFYLLSRLDLSRLKTATGVPGLNREDAYREMITLPSFHEQRRIVDLLSRAEGIVRLRREAEKKATELIPALFNDMFGDPATNPKGWPVSTLGQVVEEFRYGTSQKSGPIGLPVLRIPNVIGNQIDPSEMKLVSVPVAEVDRLRLLNGDFLFVRTNGNPDYVGRSAVFDEDVMQQAGFDGSNTLYASYLIRARIQRNILEPYFLQGYLSSTEGRRKLKERCKTSAGQFNINTAGLASIPIFLPPMAAQLGFVQRSLDIFGIQSQQATATAKAQATFDALLADAFKPA
ncbi:MAG: restriction endonuclease subunit S [Ferruginibacter sp.]|nr:restriction endonuclease subunit S [Rhodoferax sp.]